MEVKVIYKNSIKCLTVRKNDRLLDILLQNNIKINTDCGGIGKCLKCKVQLLCGNINTKSIDKNGYILACESYITENITIKLLDSADFYDNSKIVNNGDIKNHDMFGIAFDLGTTTLAFSLIDITTNSIIETFSELNKQAQFGADVISRISQANEGKLHDLHTIIVAQLLEAIEYFCKKYNIKITRVVVSGNTTMLHLFMNISPKSIGVAPFLPSFVDCKKINGNEFRLPVDTIDLLPSFSAYIGADIASGVQHIDLQNNELLVDLGTNGEIIYKNFNQYFATSTAAGPCLEGATIDCGIGGVNGAICSANIDCDISGVTGAMCSATLDSTKIKIKTILNSTPTGICGAGLVDIIACLLRLNIIDNTGLIKDGKNKIYITDSIYISQQDIRKFQLAKSAICSGIKTLANETKCDLANISKVYIAGGIGYHINIDNAILTGILPKELLGKVTVLNNTSLLGATDCLCNESLIFDMQKITKKCTIIDLNDSEFFANNYIEEMLFNYE